MSQTSRFTVIIPARYQSSRLPGKPLAVIAGKPMVQHVYERALDSEARKVIVATDDVRIEEAVKAFGGQVCMTSNTHESGTDRIHEVVTGLGLANEEIVVNVQGDEPLIPPKVINQVAQNLLANTAADAATLSEPIKSMQDFLNPNSVKVVASELGMALYFSRSPIPFDRDGDEHFIAQNKPQRHIGIYAYRVGLLKKFVQWPMARLETIEKLEQLRILANDCHIHISETCMPVPRGIDTPEDLEKIRAIQ